MSIITLDFETFFRSARNRGSIGPAYSLKSLTYEQYIRDELFKVHGVGIKVDAQPKKYYYGDEILEILTEIFFPGNDHVMICHNTMFDGAILSWYYGLRAKFYYCTQAMSQAIWAQCSASLDALAKRLWPDDKTMRKGKELESFDGIEELDHAQQQIMGGYCGQDVDLTFEAFRSMYPYFPAQELEVLDMTLQMFIHPIFILDRPRVAEYERVLTERKEELIRAAGVPRAVLSSNQQFARFLEREHGIIVPMKPSPTKTNPDNMTLALAKNDVEFILMQADKPHLKHIWLARIAVKSSGELSRCVRLLDHAQVSSINRDGWIAAPLKYCGAHTKRFSGANKVNFQNFKRGSPLRLALQAPPGHKLLVRDLAAIEGRMSAWFFGHTAKLQMYADKLDIYSVNATDIFARPINRKKLAQDAGGNYLDKEGNIVEKDFAHHPDEMEGKVGKEAELSLTYQMGATKFQTRLFLAGVPDATETFAKKVVTTWRAKNQPIVKGWAKCEQIIYDMARKDLVPYKWGCITVEKERLRLPNGLYLTYPGLRLADKSDGSGQQFEYWEGKFWKSLYGGLLTENIIQAISRIVMTDMMCAIQRRITPYGARIALTVHDEIVASAPDEYVEICMAIMEEEMARLPSWCAYGGLTLTSEGGYAQNYSK